MAIKEIVTKICICDLCQKQVEDENQLEKLIVPVKFLTEQTEGRSCKPYFINKSFDLCVNCLEKVTVVLGQGAQGYNQYWFKSGD